MPKLSRWGNSLGVRIPDVAGGALCGAALQHIGVDEMAFSLSAQQKGLFGQLLVGHDHGDAAHAQQLGIGTVYQEVNLCTNLTIGENVMLAPQVVQKECRMCI